MNYLYHRVPKKISGTILHPLNSLKNIYPEIYTEEIKKGSIETKDFEIVRV